MKLSKLSVLGIAFIAVMFSCKTTGTVMMDSVNEKDKELLVTVELDLLKYAATGNTDLLPVISESLSALNAKDTANREFLSWRACLNAEYVLRTNPATGKKKAEKLLEEASKFNMEEQRIFLVKALMTADSSEKRSLLKKGADLPWATRIWLDLGLSYFESGEYRESVAAFDSAFIKLPESYNVLFQSKRDSAFALRDTGLKNPSSVGIIGQEKLTLKDLVILIYNETGLMKNIASDLKDKKLFSRLLSDSFLSEPSLTEEQTALRRETAFFITALISYQTGQADLKTKAADYYRKKGLKSPIPDVPVDSPWFGAAVYCIEQDIMDLPDGMKFFPNRPVTGAEMRETIKALKKLYPQAPKG